MGTDTITLTEGDSAVCTITNDDIPGRIKIIKTTIGGNDTFGFTIRGPSASTPSITTNGETGNTGFISVNAGTYSVDETTIPSGWDLTNSSCTPGTPQSFNVPLNGSVTCTFENTKRGHLIVQKTTLPASDPTVFSISATGTGSISGGGAGTVTDALDKDYEVAPGTYFVSETVPAGWDKTGDTCQDVVVGPGKTKYCEITNTKRGHIIIQKNAIPDSSQEFAFNNNFDNGNPATFNLTDDSTSGLPSYNAEVLPETYSVSEDPVSGWQSPESTSCSDGSPVNAIEVSPGETVTCTFVNEKLATVILIKNTVGGNGTFDFTMTGEGLPASTQITTSGNTGNQTFNDLDPDNTYTIAETVPAGWDLTSPVCTGTNQPDDITLNAGELITCTFTNTQRGSISGYKWEDVDGDGYWDGGEPARDGWTIFLDKNANNQLDVGEVSTTTSGGGVYTFANLVPGDYDVCEVLESGWVRTLPGPSLDCYHLTVLPGQNLTGYDFGNFKCVTIRGYKWLDKNIGVDGSGRGVKDPEDTFEDGWEIQLHQGTVLGKIINTATTGADGYYEFQVCEPGNYIIDEVNQSGYTQTHPGSQGQDAYYQVEVTSGTITPTGSHAPEEDGLGFDFANFKNIKISGYKFNDLDGDGVWDPGEPPIQGWLIQYWGSSNGRATTNSSGYYELPNPVMGLNGFPPGTYSVGEPSIPAGWTQTTIPEIYYFEWPSEDIENVNFGNFKYGQIKVCKYDDLSGNGDFDLEEPGIASVSMTLQGRDEGLERGLEEVVQEGAVNGWENLDEIETQKDGCYTFTGLGLGIYRVLENLEDPDLVGYYPTDGLEGTSAEISLTLENQKDEVNFYNSRYATLGDFVWKDINDDNVQDPGEPGVEGVEVNLYLDDDDGILDTTLDTFIGTQTTDANGNYLFNNLIKGDYFAMADETTLPDGGTGWIISVGGSNPQGPITLLPGDSNLDIDFGFAQPIEVSLIKGNDKPDGASVGDLVTYTLTTTVGERRLISMTLMDNLPEGFIYQAGSATVNGGTVDSAEPILSNGGKTLTWNWSAVPGSSTVIVTYQIIIDSSNQPASYTNFAWVYGHGSGEAESDIVSSVVVIDPTFTLSTVISPQILGVETERVKTLGRVLGAKTGSDTWYLIIALILIASGILIRRVDPNQTKKE